LEFLIAGAYDFFYIGKKIFEMAGSSAFFFVSIVHLNLKSLNLHSNGGLARRASIFSGVAQLVRASRQ
jgi:hypothetical protein